jgi:hemin uptake protein HemP
MNQAQTPVASSAAPQRSEPWSAQPQLDSRMLFCESREVLIAHNGEHYRLRLTRAGKLILTK